MCLIVCLPEGQFSSGAIVLELNKYRIWVIHLIFEWASHEENKEKEEINNKKALMIYFEWKRKLVKGNMQLLFLCNPENIRRFMSFHCIFFDNSKKSNHRHVSKNGTDLCNSKLFKNIHIEKDIHLFFCNISERLRENQSLQVVLWKDCAFICQKQIFIAPQWIYICNIDRQIDR